MIIAILLLVFFGLIYIKLYLPLQYWKNRGIPHLSPLLIFGNLGAAVFRRKTFNQVIQEVCDRYKSHRYFGFYTFYQRSLVILDRDLIKEMFIKKFEHFVDHVDFVPKDVDPFWGKGLFAREGDDWHGMRATISPTFTSKKMKAMFCLMLECSERFVNHFQKKNATVTLDIMDAFTKLTNDLIASCAFGIHCDSLENENNEFYLMGKKAFNFNGLNSIKFFGNHLSPMLSRLFNIKMFSNKVKDFFLRITKETIAYRKQTGLYRPDVMHLLIEAQKGRLTHDEDDDDLSSTFVQSDKSYSKKTNLSKSFSITDEDIASQAFIFFFGSYDTVSAVLSHTAHELVANLNVQEKLIDEIDQTLNQCNGKITYETIMKSKYLDMVISETLRLWPPPSTISRICVKPFIIEPILPHEKRVVVEPGTEIIIPVFAFHRNPEYFKNPDSFEPDRFARDNIKPLTYFPFGVGPRHCIGFRFALIMMKVIIFTLLSQFQVVPVEKTVMAFEQSRSNVLLRKANGYWFGLKPRMNN